MKKWSLGICRYLQNKVFCFSSFLPYFVYFGENMKFFIFTKRKDLMKIPKINFQIKPIPSQMMRM